MEQQIKNIISPYIKTPVDQINASTIIDRTAVGSSIILHRMYAQLGNEGIAVPDYWDIKTFGALLQKLNEPVMQQVVANDIIQQDPFSISGLAINSNISIGIDIEQVGMMPTAIDYREDEFYGMNFSAQEIAYCILQPNPIASFTGLFAAKEAIVKADNSYMNQGFNTIVIEHLPGGRPVHPSFHLSISHTGEYAVAVATPIKNNQAVQQPLQVFPKNTSSLNLFSLTAFILSILAIILALFYHK